MAELNEQLRNARGRTASRRTPGACLGRQELAELVNEWIYTHRRQITAVDKNYIGKLERGVIRWPDEAYRAALRAVLGAGSDAQLGFYDTRRMPAGTTAADRDEFLRNAAIVTTGDPLWCPTMAAEQVADDTEGVDTNRRQVLTGSALGLFGTATATIAHLLDHPRGRVPPGGGAEVVEHFTRLRAVLVDSDNRIGATWVLPTVHQQLDVISQLRRQAHGRLHTQLLGVESRWAEFAGWLSNDLGDHDTAGRWLSRSLSMAQEAGDRDFAAFLFARLAQQHIGGDDEDRIAGLAHAATRVGTTHPYVQAFAILQRAHGCAFAGDTYQFEVAVDQARALVDQPGTPPDDLGSFCTAAYVYAQEGQGWLRMGRPKVAARRFGDALAMWPGSYHRDRGLYLAHAGAAQLADRQPDEAATLALEAFELAEATRSSRVGRQVYALSRQLTRFGDRPATRRLLAAIDRAGQVRQ